MTTIALPTASAAAVRRHARRQMMSHPRELAVVVLLHALAAAAGLVTPRLLGDLVQQVQHGTDHVTSMGLYILLFYVLQALLLAVAVFASTRLAEKVAAQLREDFIDDVLALPLARVEDAGSGDLITRSTSDVDALIQVARSSVPSVLVTSMTLLASLIALILTGPVFLLAALVAVPFVVPTARWYLARSRPGYLRERETNAKAAEALTETIAGARTVESFAIAPWRESELRAATEDAMAAQWYTLWLRSIFLPITDSAIALPTVAALILGGIGYAHGWASLGAVTAATLYVQQMAAQIDLLLYQQDKLQVGSAAMARLLGLREESDHAAPAGPAVRLGSPRDIVLDHVSFSYTSGREVLSDLQLTIRQGERLAIVGPSGAGKTTLAHLIAGLDRPGSGRILLGGVDLQALPREQLRREVALVTQDAHVFRGSARDNLRIAAPTADDRRLLEAMELVGATRWLNEIGLDAPLGSGGHVLSPAEAQQLALARLVLTDPHTLVLDEATSLLDPNAARDLERSLAALMRDRTVIFIAHRLHTAHDADRIVLMREGRIVEAGSHDQLVGAGGDYARLWHTWQGEGPAPGGR